MVEQTDMGETDCWRERKEVGLNSQQFDSQTSSNAEDPHNTDDGGVDRDDVGPHLLQDNTHDGENDNENIQLVPAVTDVAQEAQGHNLHYGLQDEHAGEEVVEDLQCKLQLLPTENTWVTAHIMQTIAARFAAGSEQSRHVSV